MNILIVDDDYYGVEGIKQKLGSSSLPLDELYLGYSMADAQRIFQEKQVDILISDIEMPRGSGLELLEWIRRQQLFPVVIFLTSYANFDYASKALKLQSTDYLLKPVAQEELLSSVRKAIAVAERQKEQKEQRLHAQYWDDARIQSLESFWKKLASKQTSPSRLMVYHELSALHLPESTVRQTWLPVLLHCRPCKDAAKWESALYEYAVKNILMELLFEPEETPVMPSMDNFQYLILLYPRGKEHGGDRMDELRRAKRICEDTLSGSFHFFLGELCDLNSIGDDCAELQRLAKNTIYEGSLVFDLQSSFAEQARIAPPAWKQWGELLLSQKIAEAQKDILIYLAGLRQVPQATRKDLVSFQHDFMQMIYNILDKTGAYAHDLLSNDTSEAAIEEACNSIGEMQDWIVHVLQWFRTYLSENSKSTVVLEIIKKYIEDHLSDELDRNTLSAAVYLSPDYISHLFTERVGVSLTNYITSQRIRRAKELLYQRHLSIRDVALKSGFQNISYFSKQFKRLTGQTPQEFRKARRL